MFQKKLCPKYVLDFIEQPWHRKPAFVTHDNEASLCIEHNN